MFGSICHLTVMTELSTPFVNLRAILAQHKMTNTKLYSINGIMMALMFFLFRMCFYYYMIFIVIEKFVFYRSDVFWDTYPKHQYWACYVCMVLYMIMYLLNVYWFSKIFAGLMKAFGVFNALEKSEYRTKEQLEDVKKKKTE